MQLPVRKGYIRCQLNRIQFHYNFQPQLLDKWITWMADKQLYAGTRGNWSISLPTKGPPAITASCSNETWLGGTFLVLFYKLIWFIITLVQNPMTATGRRLGWSNAIAAGQAKLHSCSTKFPARQLAYRAENRFKFFHQYSTTALRSSRFRATQLVLMFLSYWKTRNRMRNA